MILYENQRTAMASAFTAIQEYQVHVIYANALWHCKDFHRAEANYQKALELKKCNSAQNIQVTSSVGGRKGRSQPAPQPEYLQENEVRLQLFNCRMELNDFKGAKSTLEEIPNSQRTPKILSALAVVYQKERMQTPAVECLKAVIRENPLALDSILNLIQLGGKANEIIPLVHASISGIGALEWLPLWIEAQCSLNSPKTEKAVELFKKLLSFPKLQDNSELVVGYAKALCYNGDYKRANITFRSVYGKEPLYINGMDSYAASLYYEGDAKSLEELTNRLVTRCENTSSSHEPWVVLGYYSFMTSKRDTKGLYFSQKACLCNPNSTEALLLKGRVIAETKSPIEAIPYYTDAYNSPTPRFEVYKALTDSYMALSRGLQATSMAQLAMKLFGQTPRSLTLLATVLLSESGKRQMARFHLEKAVEKDRTYLPAVYTLAKFYSDEKSYDEAIEVLTKCLEFESTNKLHKMLGDCYNVIGEPEKAMHHHNIAKKLEVTYRSSEVAQSLNSQNNSRGSRSTAGHDATLDGDMDEMPESDNDNDVMEESETEVVWSDQDF